MDKSTVRPAPDSRCWKCGQTITPDDVIEDRCVLSSKGLRHEACPASAKSGDVEVAS